MTDSRPIALRRIVSGGQTGVDRAALDVAIACKVPHGGWCPAGRRAEDGPIDPRYQLRETESEKYDERTEKNVIDSDGTLILCRGELTGGTKLTRRYTRRHKRPLRVVDFDEIANHKAAVDDVRRWLASQQIEVLNVAGPRESTAPGIGTEAAAFLRKLFS